MKPLAVLSLLLLTACDPQAGSRPINDSPSGYGNARFMGTVDGCRLWSVNSGDFYFANCHSGFSSTYWRRSYGKTSHHYMTTADSDP